MNLSEKIHTAVTDAVGPDDIARADSASTKMLLAMSATGRRIYEGTVPAHVVRRRRAKNRAARAARRAGRR